MDNYRLFLAHCAVNGFASLTRWEWEHCGSPTFAQHSRFVPTLDIRVVRDACREAIEAPR